MPEDQKEAHGATIQAILDDPTHKYLIERFGNNYDKDGKGFMTADECVVRSAENLNISA